MFKYSKLLCLVGLCLLGSIRASETHVHEVGFIVGEPTGLSALWQQSSTQAIDMALAWSLINNRFIYVHGDYLFYNLSLLEFNDKPLPLYYGVGGRVQLGALGSIGMRLPLGIDYHFAGSPFSALIEIAPVINIIPATSVDLNLDLGLRYVFR